MTLWRRAPAVDEAPLEWGRFILALPRCAEERATANEASAFRWQGYDVVVFPADPVPVLLRTRMPAVTNWTACLVLQDRTPVGAVLGPTGAAPGGAWMVVIFDELAVPVALPDYVSTEWRVKPEDSR
jgi:hypothetical protein